MVSGNWYGVVWYGVVNGNWNGVVWLMVIGSGLVSLYGVVWFDYGVIEMHVIMIILFFYRKITILCNITMTENSVANLNQGSVMKTFKMYKC